MQFTKMHGIGNDYVYISTFDQPPPVDPRQLAVTVSDRHFGIGGDGLILIMPSERADARMLMFNADGSEGEMCGNGVRCVAKYVFDRGISNKKKLRIETGRGILTLDLEIEAGSVGRVCVDMGAPILQAELIPTLFEGNPPVNVPIEAGDSELSVTVVSMGNPHLVAYVSDVDCVPLETVGPLLEHHRAFPRRINVHIVEIKGAGEVKMRTWERGSGITLACGTGACAVCVAGVLTGRTGRTLLAHLPGGDLELNWPDEKASVFMTGPAAEVFSGDWPD
jgi:diaminopimelate epimerase